MKRTLALPVVSALVTATFAVVGAQPAFAATRCSPPPPPGSTFIGDLRAPNQGVPCFLDNVTIVGNLSVNSFVDVEFSTITGKITVGEFGRLVLGHSKVDGAIVASSSKSIALDSSSVGQSVRSTGSAFGTFLVCGTTINGGLVDSGVTDKATTNTIGDPASDCKPNTIKGGLVLSGNRAPAVVKHNLVGSITVIDNPSTTPYVISGNSIRANLDCSGNAVSPIGGGNTAAAKTGQCAGL